MPGFSEKLIESGLADSVESGLKISGAEQAIAWLLIQDAKAAASVESRKRAKTQAVAKAVAQAGASTPAPTSGSASDSDSGSESKEEAFMSLAPRGDALVVPSEKVRVREKAPPRYTDDQLMAVVNAWNQNCGPLRKCEFLTDKRRPHIKARLDDDPDIETWVAAAKRVADSPFCRGETGGTWLATFDWFIKPDTIVKIMEGQYDGKKDSTVTRKSERWISPGEIFRPSSGS
jgi:hypothetical protein